MNKRNQQKLGSDFHVNQGIFVLTDYELDSLSLSPNELNLIKPYYTNENVKDIPYKVAINIGQYTRIPVTRTQIV